MKGLPAGEQASRVREPSDRPAPYTVTLYAADDWTMAWQSGHATREEAEEAAATIRAAVGLEPGSDLVIYERNRVVAGWTLATHGWGRTTTETEVR
ncbi:MAG: hypothetical protein ACREQY_16960 [Candidatus Binatia bacterium]